MGTVLLVLFDVLLVLGIARVLRRVLERVRQPPVMAEVLAGIVLGASILGGDASRALFPDDVRSVLTVLGSIAVVAYLFGVGARLDLRALRAEGRAVIAVAVASFAVPFAGGVAVAIALRGTIEPQPPLLAFALFIGTAFGVTAVPVLARIIEARNLRDVPAGRMALTAAAAQELLVWPGLALAVALARPADGEGTGLLGGALLGAGALVLVLALARVVVPRLPRSAAGIGALVALGLSAAATQATGLHLVVGAFLFGVALPRAQQAAAARLLGRRAAVLASAAFLPLFFALPALEVDIGSLGTAGLGLLAVVLVVAVGTKVTSAAVAARLAGVARRDALTVGALMNARGLVELVVLAVGFEAGLIDLRWFSVLVLMALVTTFATGPAVDRLQEESGPRAPAEPRSSFERKRPLDAAGTST